MKYFKKILAVALALSFVFALVSCKKKDADDTETTTEASAVESTNDTVASAAGEDNSANAATTVATKKNVAGVSTVSPLISRTKNKNGNASDSFVKSLKGFELKIYLPWEPHKKGSDIGDNDAYCRQQVEKEFGVTIDESGKFSNYNEALTAALSSRKATNHVYMVQYFNFASYFKNNYMADLTTAGIDSGVDFKEPWYAADANAFFNIDYKQIGWISFDAEYVFPKIIIYNKTLMKKKNLVEPATLAEQGKWTWSKLEEYAGKLTSGNVKGFGLYSNQEAAADLLDSMLAQSGTSATKIVRGKAPETNLNDQNVKDCLATLTKWCKNDSVCNTWNGKEWTYGKTQFAVGNVAMLYGTHDAIKGLSGDSVTDEFGVAPFPSKTESKTYINVAAPQFVNFIPSQHQSDAAKILFLQNELYRQKYCYAQQNFQLTWREFFNNDGDTLEDACNIKYARGINKTVFSWSSICEDPNANTTTTKIVTDLISSNGGSIQTAIDSNIKGLQNAYKDVWGDHKITGKVS